MNLNQNKLNSINVKKLRTSIDREIHKASSYNPTLDGLSSIDNTLVEKPFLDGIGNTELNLLGKVNNNSPIENQIKDTEGLLIRNNVNDFILGKKNDIDKNNLLKQLDNVIDNVKNLDKRLQNHTEKENHRQINNTNSPALIQTINLNNDHKYPSVDNQPPAILDPEIDLKIEMPHNDKKILSSLNEIYNRSKMNKALICLFFIIIGIVMYYYYKCGKKCK
jgi:hypothetical protein